jgi:hypothetical protein
VLEVEPGFVLRYLRENVPAMRQPTAFLLQEVLEESAPARASVVTVKQLADLLVHGLVGSFLTPGEHPEADARAMKALFEMLSGRSAAAPGGTARDRSSPPRWNMGLTVRGRGPKARVKAQR